MHYVMLFAAILIEVAASSMLEYSNGFTKLGPSALCIFLYGVSAFLLARALLKIDLGVAYATWCSLGIIATSIVAAVVFGQKLTPLGIVGVTLILCGCLLVNLFGAAR